MLCVPLIKKIFSLKTVLRVVIATILFFSHTAFAVQRSVEEYEKLSMVTSFSIGFNGFVGHKSDGESYVEKIALLKNAEEIFIEIASDKHSTSESRLYAACGLKKVSNRNFNELFKPSFEKQVSVLRADVLRKEKFQDIYSWIQLHGCI